MYKRILAICVLVSSCLGSLASAQNPVTFSDVAVSHPNFQAVEFLKSAGIIKGYSDGTFRPQQSINRAEALKIILLSKEYLGESVTAKSGSGTANFKDLDKTQWYFDFVMVAAEAGIVEGYTDGTFKPAQNVLASESLKMSLLTLLTDFKPVPPTANPYLDVPKEAWFAPYVEKAKTMQLIQAYADFKYLPERQMSRGDFAELMFRLLYVRKNNGTLFPVSVSWNYCNNSAQGYKIKYPHDWQRFFADDHFIVWKQDTPNGQISFARIFPNSATLIVVKDSNVLNLTIEQYVKLIDYGADAKISIQTLNGYPYASVYIESSGLQDSYFQMPGGDILAVYAQVGSGPLAAQLKEEVRYMLGSIRDSAGSSTSFEDSCGVAAGGPTSVVSQALSEKEKVMSALNANVLKAGKAKASLATLGESAIVETDTIGIGTGPVDYYYTPAYDVTVKVDRDSDTILAVKSGKSSSF